MKPLPVEEAAAVDALARALVAAPRDRTTLDAAAAHLAAGRGDHLFKALLDAPGSDDAVAAIAATMAALEAMCDVRPEVAGYFMARLYPVAGRRYLHHIADAIDLYLHAGTSEALAEVLEALAREGVRPRLQKRYVAWATAIRGRFAPQ